MGRILAIDYGRKRVGIAVTDPLKIIANGLETVHSKDIFDFLEDYLKKEQVETIVVGYPLTLKNEDAEALRFINPFIKKLIKKFPEVNIDTYDERFTSKMATAAMIQGGMKKKDRQNKATVDKISAVIILQSYMEFKSMQK
ncbi:MAG: Holliday junction resolvase RuvX [Chlorobi bacterium]|nr:Holliday junction resolvase RuvX [Chlorobiota bacterium]